MSPVIRGLFFAIFMLVVGVIVVALVDNRLERRVTTNMPVQEYHPTATPPPPGDDN